MRFRLPLTALLSLWVLGAALPDARATEKEPLALAASVASARLPQSLSALPERAKVRLDAVPLDAQSSQLVALNLEKFTVFAPDAVVVVDSGSANERRLAPPAMAHFRGEVEGYPGSSAFWSVDETGHMKGILHVGEQIIVTEQPPGSPLKIAAPTSRPVDKSSDFAGRNFQCGVEQTHLLDFFQPSKPGQSKAAPPVAELSNTVYTARIALETDYEFFQLFGSQTAAAQYIADLFGYTSSTYAAEVKTNLQVGDVYLYSTSSDPWSASTTSAALNEVQAYWLANRSTVTRTVTHFMSGKGNGQGGIAYVGVLCNSTYGYGVSMSLGGNFSAANPQIVWDSVVVAHEIGHNFGSPHTHEWDTRIGGSPVDCCYRNTASGSVCSTTYGSLPGIGSLTGGTSGAGAGTIMSYCHQLSPGYSNLTLTFGLNHTKGVSPARVPTQMRTTVENAATTYPSCLVAGTMLGQSIAFGAAPSVVVGGMGTLSATASSGLPVVFSSLTASICTVSGSNGSTVLGVAAGTCNIAANQAGNSSTSAAPQVTQSFAIAAAPTYILSVNSSGAAGVAIGASPSLYAGTTNYSKTGLAAGTSLTLTAPAAAGSALFSNWSGCDTASGVTCTVAMNAAKTVTANFAPNTYAVTATASPVAGGTASCTPNPVSSGGSSTCTATPASGYTFSAWSGDCSGATCVLSNVTSPKSVGANFALATTLAPYTDNGDGSVTDPRTGLTWMRCAMGQTWAGGTCSGTASTYTWDQAVALTGATTFAGKSDWRLPNIRELQSIVDRSTYNPAINTAAFPNTQGYAFWSASSYTHDPFSAWSVDFFDGGTVPYFKQSMYYQSSDNHVRLVRSGQSLGLLNPARPTADYVDQGNGTAAHTPSGLVWKRCAEGQTWSGSTCTGSASTYTWDAARALSSSFAGNSDWRLPTAEELLSLADYTAYGPAINATLFPLPPSSLFWSASSYAPGPAVAWGVRFDDGYTFLSSDVFNVRLVRSGQSLGTFALSLSATGSGSGILTSSPGGLNCTSAAGTSSGTCSTSLASGTAVTLAATPATGSTFTGWSGACAGTSATCALTMNAAQSVTATFTPNTYAITATASPAAGGTVACTPNPVSYNGSSTCSATPTTGYSFTAWSGACTGAACSLSSVTAPKAVTATFTQNTYAVTVTASPAAGGSARCTPNPVSSGGGSTCTATPASGYTFSAWSGDCSGATCVLSNVTSPKNVGANFALATTLAPYTDNGDGTVSDPRTGLSWMRCAMGQTWAGGTCSGTASAYTWNQAVALSTTFAGQSDWRLPNVRELQSIIDRSTYSPAIHMGAFPNTPSNGVFWSASSYTYSTDYITTRWYVNFDNGFTTYSFSQSANYHVRLVRSGQSLGILNLARPTADYVDHGDGTTTHTPSGLMWKRCAEGLSWSGSTCTGSANRYNGTDAQGLSSVFAGKNDWRLPSEEELISLVDYTIDNNYSSAINTTLFPLSPWDWFWSASFYKPDSALVWGVDFGESFSDANDKINGSGYARLVRNGQSLSTFALTASATGSGSGTLTSSPGGLNCTSAAGTTSGTCSASLASGTAVTLAATPATGSTFTGWSGACAGTSATCALTMNAAQSASAGFSSTPVAPSPPAITSITAGSGSATLYFSPPSNTGGLPISGYTATCTASGQTPRSASGSSSPLTVKSLTGGVLYQCSLTATNGGGLTSTASAILPVTPKKKSNLTPILLLLLD